MTGKKIKDYMKLVGRTLLLSAAFVTSAGCMTAKAEDPEPLQGYWNTSESKTPSADEITHWVLDRDGNLTFTGLSVDETADFSANQLTYQPCYEEPYVAAAKNSGTNIKSIAINGGIKTIPTGAFAKSSQDDEAVLYNLSSVVIGEGVEKIGDSAFARQDTLTSVTFPTSSLEEIKGGAFYGCSGLTGELVIPASVKTIAASNTNVGTFGGTGYSSITVPEASELVWIYNAAFSNMPNLTTVTLNGSKLKYIDTYVFAGDENLANVTLPANLLLIGGGAFNGDTKLTQITFPSNLRYIGFPYDQVSNGFGAFQGSGLTSVEIPASVRYIGKHAFAECASLQTVEIEKGTENVMIGLPNAVASSPDITVSENTISEDGNLLYNAAKGIDLTVYNKVGWIAVDKNQALDSAIQIKDEDVEWPNKIIETSGAGEIFFNCPKLETMYIPKNVVYVSNDFLRSSPDEGKDVTVSCYTGSAAKDAVDYYNMDMNIVRKVTADVIDQPIVKLENKAVTLESGEVWDAANRENIGFSDRYDQANDARARLEYKSNNTDIVTFDTDGNMQAQNVTRDRNTMVTITNSLTGAEITFTVYVKKGSTQPSQYKALTKAPLTWMLLDEGKTDYSVAGTRTLTASMMYKPYINEYDGATGDTYGLVYEDRVNMNVERKELLPAGYDTLIEYGINIQTGTTGTTTGTMEMTVPAAYAPDSAKVVEVSKDAKAELQSAAAGSATYSMSIPAANGYADISFIVAYKKAGASNPSATDPGQQQGTTETQTAELPKAGETVQDKDGASYVVTGTENDETGKEVATLSYAGDDKASGKVKIPETAQLANGAPAKVTAIEDGAFEKNTAVTAVTIPKSIKTIGKNAFKDCRNIKSVTVKGNAITLIGDGAFRGCKKLKSFTIGKNVSKVGAGAFSGCAKLSKLTFKSANVKFGKNALKNLKKGKRVTVYYPKSLKGKKLQTFKKKIKKAGLKNVKWKKG